MRRDRARSIYVNGCPCWECPVCGTRFNSNDMDVADAHVRRCCNKTEGRS
jgi:hypothetical protein